MGEHRAERLRHIYRILNDVTPLTDDCGSLCGARCCGGGEHDGMWLLPDEETLLKEADFLSIRQANDGKYAVCGGRCDRELRPFACRIFPFFPVAYKGRDGRYRIRVMPDTRALAVCPLLLEGGPEVSPRFRRAVRRAGRLMLGDRKLRKWLFESGDYLTDIARVRALLEE